MTLIIDCHGHYTVLPKGHDTWRAAQTAAFKAGEPAPPYPAISDDDIRETIEANQLRLIKERGADLTIFSPRASAMLQQRRAEWLLPAEGENLCHMENRAPFAQTLMEIQAVKR